MTFWCEQILQPAFIAKYDVAFMFPGPGERHQGAPEHGEQSKHVGHRDHRAEFHAGLESAQ